MLEKIKEENLCLANQENVDFWLKRVKAGNIRNLNFACKAIRSNKQFMMYACKKDWRAITCASEKLKQDEDLAEICISQNGLALRIMPKFASNLKFILMALENNPEVYKYVERFYKTHPKVLEIMANYDAEKSID